MLDLCVILNTRYDYQILLWQVGGESLHVSPSQYTILAPSNSVLSEQWNVKIAPPAFCTAVPSYTELTSLGSHPGSVIYNLIIQYMTGVLCLAGISKKLTSMHCILLHLN